MYTWLPHSNPNKLHKEFLQTYSGDGQGHVEVLAPLQAEAPGSRSIQSHTVSHAEQLSQAPQGTAGQRDGADREKCEKQTEDREEFT